MLLNIHNHQTCLSCSRLQHLGSMPVCGFDQKPLSIHLFKIGCPDGKHATKDTFTTPANRPSASPAMGTTIEAQTPEEADLIAASQDKLWGDKMEAWAQKHGLDKAAKLWERMTGIPCGCGWRKRLLNWLNVKLKPA